MDENLFSSFVLDDDEQLYMLRASNTGIRIIKMTDDFQIESSRTLDNTVLGGWTEGPYLLKKDDIYYLTYTGNNVTSEGYRIAYSYSSGELFKRDAFTEGDTIVLNTDNDFKGLGHSSTVLGPDLDSYYLAYHNLNSSGGPDRSNNISRLSFSGTEMIVENASLYNNIMPNMPAFAAKDIAGLEEASGKLLSKTGTSDVFSVEYNFIGNNTKMICSYIDDSNYYYINVNNNSLSLNKVANGSDTSISSVDFNKSYDYSKLHTIRLAYKDGKLSVFFDNMNKMTLNDVNLPAGKIGYIKSSDLTICYTAFSNVAHGSSDNNQIHQNRVLASNYYSSSFTSSNVVLNKEEDAVEGYNGKLNSYDVNLKTKNDSATYKIYADKDGRYGIDMLVMKGYEGKRVILKVDNETPIRMTIPSSNDIASTYYKTTIGDLNLTKGAHYLTIICEDEIRYHGFSYFLTGEHWPIYENDLSDYVDKGAKYVNSWKIKDEGHYALSGNRNLMYFGDETLTDYTVEVDIELIGETQASTCGIILRADNPAFASVDNVSSIQGYYVGFNNSKVFITKCDYNNSVTDASADAYNAKSNVSYHLKVTVSGNLITLDFNNGAVQLSFADDIGFTHGSFGLYTDGAAAIYRNLKIYH